MLRCLILGLLLLLLAQPANAEHGKGVSGSTIVRAPQEKVWQVISGMGNFDDKLKTVSGSDAVVEQKFKTLPFLGEITMLIKARVHPMERIDFQLIESDRIKFMQGSWSLTPLNDRETRLFLSMNVEPDLPVPKFIVNQFVAGRLRGRLKKVKALAERSNTRQAQKSLDSQEKL